MWFIVTVFLVFGAGRIEAQSCRSTAAQQCRDRIFQIIQQHTQDFTGNDATTLCPTLRDNMACLLWQSANCQTREQQQRSGEHILAAKNYLDRFCDFDGGWRNSRCYQYDEISHCENVFNQRRGSDACIAYNRFKDCVKEVLQKRCSRSDEQSFPSFLVERARELAWTCAAIPGGSSSSFYDHNRHDPANPAIAGARYNNERTGSNYDPNNPNSRYNSDVSNRYSTGYDRYGDRYGTGDRNRPAGYLPNQYDDSYCLHKAQDQIRECDGNHQRRQYNARRYHADERIKESCCATLDYKSCLRNSLTNHCREFGYNTIDSIIAQKVRDADNDCRQFDAYRCTSGTSGLHATPGAGTLAAALGALLLLAWHQTAGGRFD